MLGTTVSTNLNAFTNPLNSALARAAGAHTNPFFNSNSSLNPIGAPASEPNSPIQDSVLRSQEQLAVAKKLVSKQRPGQQMPEWCKPKRPEPLGDLEAGPRIGIDPKPTWLNTLSKGAVLSASTWPIGVAAG